MKLVHRIKRLYNQVAGLFPSRLPVGATEFAEWADSIAATYDLPTKDQDSIRYTFATMIMHLGPRDAFKAKFKFALMMHAACAKQVAGAAFYEIKQRQQELQKAAQAEATATQVVADGSQR